MVVDAGVVVAALVDETNLGGWADELLRSGELMAPSLMPFEVVNVLRRSARVGQISEAVASLAHADLGRLTVELAPYSLLASRVWELRENLTSYNASYVALAERLDSPLATLDRRLARAPGVGCRVVLPPG